MGKLSAGGGGRKNHFSIPLGLDRHCFPAGFVIYCNHIDYSTPRREVPYDMINLSQRMVALGTAKSEIREAFAFAQARAAAVGPWVSACWVADMVSERGIPARRPLGVAPVMAP